jgi:beta-lactamase class A
VGRSIHYEYGGGVEERGRLSFVFWAIICIILFAASAAAPRVLQHYGLLFPVEAEQVARATEDTPAVELHQAAPEPDKEVEATVPVDAKLQALITNWAERNDNQDWGVSVEVLGDEPEIAQYQPLVRMYPASLYKLLITHSLSEKVPAEEWSRRTVHDYRGAHAYSECVDLMLRLSDNACGEAIGTYLNWNTVDGRLGAIGLENTKLNSFDNRFTTAADMSKFMRLLYEEPILSHRAKDLVMTSLKTQKYRDGIPAGSTDCTVYNKIGDLNGYRHDVAIVECDEVTYSLAIMSKGGSYKQIASLAGVINQYLVR